MLKINDATKKTKFISLAAIFVTILGLGIFCYYYYYKDNNQNYSKHDFTISAAMANANKTGVIICSIIEFFLIFYLHKLRNNFLINILGNILICIIIAITISILYITPHNNLNAHIFLAGIGFIAILIYNFLILSILYIKYRQLWLIFLFLIPNIIIALSLIIAISIPDLFLDNIGYDLKNFTFLDTLFAVGEMVLIFLLLSTIFLLGFYRSKKLEKIKKANIKSKQIK